jgi:hypothetical protein
MSEKKKPQGVASTPNIVEAYRNYIPPQCVLTMVEDLLKTVPPRYLLGLQTITLTNQAAQPSKLKKQKVWSRNRKIKLVAARGYYSPANRATRATISLHVDNILKGMRPGNLRVPFVRYFPLATVLYHEIGHHIHAEHIPIHDGKENVAEDWSDKLLEQFYRTHYWYLMPLLTTLAFLIKLGRSVKTLYRRTFSGR